MGICAWIVFGFFAGLIARALLPGNQAMGLIKTTLLGIGGSFIGGEVAALILGRSPFVLHPSGFIGSVLGALLLLLAGHWFFGRNAG
jgi:uncharacterized membrane protein YeaQ/YmgE (transglycosylase-associated protein family)